MACQIVGVPENRRPETPRQLVVMRHAKAEQHGPTDFDRHLAERGTSCVCDLQDRVPVASNLLSYHLKVLRDTGLVTTARRGRWIDYTLAADAAERLADALPVDTTDIRP